MELRVGLDYVLQHPEYTRTLAAALASGDASLRHQVWELLASLCPHGDGGLKRVLSTLEQLASLQGQRGRLAPLAHALAQETGAPQGALLTLANCALSSRDRARLRAELRARGVAVPPALASAGSVRKAPPASKEAASPSPALQRQALTTLAAVAAGGPQREAQLLRLLERLPTLKDDAWEQLGREPTTRCDCSRQQAAAEQTGTTRA
ncbi:unnamed protein product, partial [Ixodes hexagonus]